MIDKMSLSERMRLGREAAPWCIDEVEKLEAEIKKLGGPMPPVENLEMFKNLLEENEKLSKALNYACSTTAVREKDELIEKLKTALEDIGTGKHVFHHAACRCPIEADLALKDIKE